MLVRELRKLLQHHDQDAEVILNIDTSDQPDIPFSEVESFIDDVKRLETDNDGHVVLPGWIGTDDDAGDPGDEEEDDGEEGEGPEADE